jgi:hypothetical protein
LTPIPNENLIVSSKKIMRILSLLFPTVFVFVLIAHFCSAESKETIIWSGQSGGFAIRWSDTDINAHPVAKPSAIAFSTKTIGEQASKAWFESQKQYEEPGEEEYSAENNCDFGTSYRLFSIVGPLLTFEYSESAVCSFAAHPDLQVRLITFDLSKSGDLLFSTSELDSANPGKAVLLTDFFAEAQILTALLQSRLIQQEIQRRKAKMPVTLNQLAGALNEPSTDTITTDDCGYSFPIDFASRFVFHDVENDKAIVRIALPSAIGACRASQLLLTIRLDIPDQLKLALAEAAAGKQGYLMKDLAKLGPPAQSDFPYEISPK